MRSTNDSLGRTVMIAVIAGVLFAGFLALTPRLTAGSQTEDQIGPAAVDAPGMAETAVSDPIVAIPGVAFDGFDGGNSYVEQEADDGTDWSEDESSGDDEWADEDDSETVFDGSLGLTVEVFGPSDGKESVILNDYDIARFQITVDNESSEELWGLFVYLEGYGEVECGTSHLTAGDRVDCVAYDVVYSGTDTAEVWANAWTSEHQVGVEVAHDFYVAH
jgi:hypothetical protein